MYVDDVPFGSSTAYAVGSGTALDMGLLDLNHIEILRGPQGTMYGASAMGGLIKYVTNEPDTTRFFGRAMAAAQQHPARQREQHRERGPERPASARTSPACGSPPSATTSAASSTRSAPAAGTDVNTGNTVGGRVALLAQPHVQPADQADRDQPGHQARKPGLGGLRRRDRQTRSNGDSHEASSPCASPTR